MPNSKDTDGGAPFHGSQLRRPTESVRNQLLDAIDMISDSLGERANYECEACGSWVKGYAFGSMPPSDSIPCWSCGGRAKLKPYD